MNHLVILPVVVPLLAGSLLLALAHANLPLGRAVSLLSVTVQAGIALVLLSHAAEGTVLTYRLGNWPPPFGIVLVSDRLSALMVSLAGALALPALAHGCAGGDRLGPGFHALFQFQMMGFNGAFLTGDLFNLFVFFEILLIASYGLLLHGGGAMRTRAGLHYAVLNLVGSSIFLLAVGLLYGIAGTLNMADLAQRLPRINQADKVVVDASALLLLVVFSLKAALVPLHFWIAPAYASATAPVAALFAIATKVGVYAVVRIYTLIFSGELIAPWVMPLALITVFVGGLGVVASDDLRRQIAWMVVISVGTLLAGVALFTRAGIGSALYYLVHTTLVTGGLFLLADLAGARREGTRLEPGGRVPYRAWIGTLFLVGGASVAGLPPVSGFLGKLALMQAASDTAVMPWLWIAVLAGSLATLLATSRAGSILFWKSDDAPTVAAPAPLLVAPAAVLLSASLWLAVWAAPVIAYTEATAAQLLAPGDYLAAVLHRPREVP